MWGNIQKGMICNWTKAPVGKLKLSEIPEKL